MIYLVRHGQTDWNRKKIIQGWINDIPLNETGRKQAFTLAKYFSNKHLAYIVSSPIKRAHQTAKIVAHRKNIKILTDKNFKEINYGIWSGKKGSEIEKLYPEQWKEFISTPEDFRFQEGESLEEFYSRVIDGLEKLKNENDVLVVTHVNPIRIILSHILSIPVKNAYHIRIENCAVSGMKYRNGKWEVDFLNCRMI